MPLVGGAISGDYGAYRYLNDSVMAFPEPDEFLDLMKRAGFVDIMTIYKWVCFEGWLAIK